MDDNTPHITIDWSGEGYGLGSALKDVVLGASLWPLIAILVLIIVCWLMFWSKRGENILTDQEGEYFGDQKYVSWMPDAYNTLRFGVVAVVSLLFALAIFGLFSTTYNDGKSLAFRSQVSEKLSDQRVFINVGDTTSYNDETRTAFLSSTDASPEMSGKTCTMVNMDSSKDGDHGQYRISVVCDGKPLNLSDD